MTLHFYFLEMTMKLYYSPGACSLSPHIVLHEAGYNFVAEKVDLKTKKTESGKDFSAINEKGSVPFLVLDNGEGISEGAVIVQYLADQKPASQLAPSNGTIERVRLNEWLNFIATDLHKSFMPFFAGAGEQATTLYRKILEKKFEYVAKKLQGREYLTGSQFTIADAYLFTVMNWAPKVGIDLSPWPVLAAYSQRVAARPKVQEALVAEGLQKKAA